jgi:hypothetical protein
VTGEGLPYQPGGGRDYRLQPWRGMFPSHEIALIPKGIKAGYLRRGCDGLNIWNSRGNYCVAPKSVGSQTMNEDCSRSQHGELTASRTGGTDQFNVHSELHFQILVRPNYAEKVQIHNELAVSIIILDDAANHKQCEMKKQPAQNRY